MKGPMKRYRPEDLMKLAAEMAAAAGVPAGDARRLADSLVQADLEGVSTHGLSRLGIYIRRIRKGLIDPRAELSIDRRRPNVLTVDAGNGLGQVQAWKVLDELIPAAKAYAIASATIRNSQHFGALSYYTNRCAAQGLILVAMTNCEPAMAPAGGCDAFFGTNPLAASFPTGKEFNVKIDLSTSIIARGHIIAAANRKEPIPSGWAMDRDGNPTTDASEALLGTVLTMAGHKGYALAMMVELFAGVLSGSAIGPSIGSMYKDLDRKQDVGHFFCLFDIDAFMDLSTFKARIDSMIDQIKSGRKRGGVQEIMIPGERSHRTTIENEKYGIALNEVTLRELKALCKELEVDCSLFDSVVERAAPGLLVAGKQ